MRGGWRSVCASDIFPNAVDRSESGAVGYADTNADTIANRNADVTPLAVSNSKAERRAIADTDVHPESHSYTHTLNGAQFASILTDADSAPAGGADARSLAASDFVSLLLAIHRTFAGADARANLVANATTVAHAYNDADRAAVSELCGWHLDL